MNHLKIEINDDEKMAPRYDDSTIKLEVKIAIITPKGTTNDNPIVDIQMEDSKGQKYFFMTTGSLMKGLGQAIAGVEARNVRSKAH